MRLALLAGASPQRSSDGPTSRLVKGMYHIRVEGLRDSVLLLDVDGVQVPLNASTQFNNGDSSNVQVKWKTRGTELSLTVIAERLRD